jgi:deoxyadenosine/deoxycytidine kinase
MIYNDIMLLIIISGPSGVGKTTLAKQISKDFKLPLIYKDGFKEILFDQLGIKDELWSKSLGFTSFVLLQQVSRQLMEVGISHIIEAPFTNDNTFFNEMQAEYNFKVLQIQLRADKEDIYQRMKSRVEKGERHLGHHLDRKITEQDVDKLTEFLEPLAIDGALFKIDTSNSEQAYKKELHEIIKDLL